MSTKPRRPKQASKKSAATRRRDAEHDLRDKLSIHILHARAATMTAVLALQGNGVFDNIAITLRGVNSNLEKMRELIRRRQGRNAVGSHHSTVLGRVGEEQDDE